MNIYIVSIFPEIYYSYLKTSLIEKWIKNKKLKIELVNPRDFTYDKHKQVDDEIYGGWKWMLLKAKPVIDSINSILEKLKTKNWKLLTKKSFKIIYLAPSTKILNQEIAFEYSKIKNVILVCGRYEGIDHRFEQYFESNYPNNFEKISIWKYVLMGWEVASMVLIEAMTRLIPWVIKEEDSFMIESYSPEKQMENIEFPQYTRPEEVYWMKVPDILLSWNHKKIEQWRNDNEKKSS